jgi:hypothetical protein
MAAGVADSVWNVADIVAIIEAAVPAPAKRGPYKSKLNDLDVIGYLVCARSIAKQLSSGICFGCPLRIGKKRTTGRRRQKANGVREYPQTARRSQDRTSSDTPTSATESFRYLRAEKLKLKRRQTTDGHPSGAQTAGGRLVFVNPVREDASASAFPATQPLYKTCYGRFWRYAKIGQIFLAQKAFVAATQASHVHDKFGRLAHGRR